MSEGVTLGPPVRPRMSEKVAPMLDVVERSGIQAGIVDQQATRAAEALDEAGAMVVTAMHVAKKALAEVSDRLLLMCAELAQKEAAALAFRKEAEKNIENMRAEYAELLKVAKDAQAEVRALKAEQEAQKAAGVTPDVWP